MRENLQQIVTDARFVVVHVAGSEYCGLAGRRLAVADRECRGRLGGGAEICAVILRQHAVLVHAEHFFHNAARGGRLVGGVDEACHHRNGRQLAERVGRRQQLVTRRGAALPEFDRLRAQHQVREVDIPLVRRHVWALGHVTRIAQVAAVDDFPEFAFLDAIEFAGLAFIDQIKQARECRAQIHAAPATVTDIEHSLQLGENFFFFVEVGRPPVESVPGRGFEISFANGHDAGEA